MTPQPRLDHGIGRCQKTCRLFTDGPRSPYPLCGNNGPTDVGSVCLPWLRAYVAAAEELKRENARLATQLVYERIVPKIVQIAKDHGYAIGIHGSLQRDCDLFAVPWSENSKPPDELAEAVRRHVNGTFEQPHPGMLNPEARPQGRLSWAIHLDATRYIDLSVFCTWGAFGAWRFAAEAEYQKREDQWADSVMRLNKENRAYRQAQGERE